MHIHVHYHPDEETAERLVRIEDMLGQILEHQEKIMSDVDDLKTSLAALIAETTADITALIQKIGAQSSDPAIHQMVADAQAATKDLHDKFTAATGTPVPAPTT